MIVSIGIIYKTRMSQMRLIFHLVVAMKMGIQRYLRCLLVASGVNKCNFFFHKISEVQLFCKIYFVRIKIVRTFASDLRE